MSNQTPLPFLLINEQPAWQMPELPSLRKLPAHATFWPFPSAQAAFGRVAEQSSLVHSLNGNWDFTLFDTPYEVTAEALRTAPWRQLAVPGNWTMQLRHEPWDGESFMRPHYTNIQMPFAETFPHLPATIATGVYRTRLRVPSAWAEQRVVLHFAGCEGALFVYLNGAFVGFNKDSRTPAEYDITELVQLGGEYELLCVNPRYSDASWLEDQDHWWQAGIHRDVYLYTTPITFLQDITVQTDLADDFSTGTLRVHTTVRTLGQQASGTIHMQLFTADGNAVFPTPLTSGVPGAPTGFPMGHTSSDTANATLVATVDQPACWNTETPNLYTLIVTLDAAGTSISTAVRIGFRIVDITNRELRVNRQPIFVHGVNYHEHSDEFGKAVPRAMMERDIQTMKAHNINAVRCSHYPNHPYWLDLCDQYGLFVVDEANIEHHALLRLSQESRVSAAYLERVSNMVARDKNHPSVIVWSLGNESGYGINHETSAAWIRHTDPTRPIQYEGAVSPFNNDQSITFNGTLDHWKRGHTVTDIVAPMYAPISDIVKWVSTTNDPRPLILCEYAHAMGNSSGSLADYYAAFEQHHGLQGGFIWEWLDHGIRMHTPAGEAYWVYGGSFGDVPNDRNFVADGMVWPDRTPHPGMREFMYLARPVRITASDSTNGVFGIENRRFYTTLADLHGTWRIVVDGTVTHTGTIAIPAIAPQSAGTITIPVQWPASGEAFVEFAFATTAASYWAPAGHIVAWDQIAGPVTISAPTPHTATQTVSSVSQTHLILTNNQHRVFIDRTTGELSEFNQRQAIIAGPQLNLWRAPTDNDHLQEMFAMMRLQAFPLWRSVGLTQLQYRVTAVQPVVTPAGEHCIEVRTCATGRERWDDIQTTHTYTLTDTGSLRISTHVTLAPDLVDLPRIGITLQLDPAFEALSWYGRGPHENYSDRNASSMVGTYHSTVSDQYTPYIMPQENGHKGDVRWLSLTDNAGQTLTIRGDDWFGFNALHYRDADLEAAQFTPELHARPEIILNLDHGMRGLGTGLMVDTLPAYQLHDHEYHFTFEFCWEA